MSGHVNEDQIISQITVTRWVTDSGGDIIITTDHTGELGYMEALGMLEIAKESIRDDFMGDDDE